MDLHHLEQLRHLLDLLAAHGEDVTHTRPACYSGVGFTFALRAAEANGHVVLVDLDRLYREVARQQPRSEAVLAGDPVQRHPACRGRPGRCLRCPRGPVPERRRRGIRCTASTPSPRAWPGSRWRDALSDKGRVVHATLTRRKATSSSRVTVPRPQRITANPPWPAQYPVRGRSAHDSGENVVHDVGERKGVTFPFYPMRIERSGFGMTREVSDVAERTFPGIEQHPDILALRAGSERGRRRR